MKFVADFHIHSHYSRATSKDASPENLFKWASYKGVTVVGTGDFTHPGWRQELKAKLEPTGEGLYRLKEEFVSWDSSPKPLVRFVVSGEVSTIYKKGGRVRKIHHLILLPSFEAADKLSRRLEEIGNIHSDGRPILGLDSRHLLEMALEICPEVLFIPAHIWTPHFSLFGANSGFDSIEECFEDLTPYICAVETGLSSDPPMNWRLSMLDRFTLTSNSDAHSPRNLAREANLFDTELSYRAIRLALKDRESGRFLGTVEFFPEEGKYHYDGHRACGIRWKPSQTRAASGVCPVCGRKVTVGVLHRVEELADRKEGVRPESARHFESLVPLPEVIASALGVGVTSKQVVQHYFSLIGNVGSELVVLREASLEQVARVGGLLVAAAIRRMRAGEVEVLPGYDGEYGKIILMRPEDRRGLFIQDSLFQEPNGEKSFSGDFAALEDGEGNSTVCPDRREGGSEPSLYYEAQDIPQSPPQDGGILAGLNLEQREAVIAQKGPVMVIAGPGTGKTRTLAHRIAYLIRKRGVAPNRITAVTFTNKAAAEMRSRVAGLLGDGEEIKALTIGTFHSICLELLRDYALQNHPDDTDVAQDFQLTVFDEADCRRILQEVLQESKEFGLRDVLKIQKRISFLKSCGIRSSSPEVPEDLRFIYRSYQERLSGYRALDYDDILLEAVHLLESWKAQGEDSGYAKDALAGFSHLLVDEFQDVNPVQYTLVRLWAGDGRNLFVIGDPNQAIYGFRGADYRFFGKLKKDFPRAQIFKLTLNYRSTATILRAASAVVANNPAAGLISTENEELVATKQSRAQVLHLEVPTEVSEGIAIVREIGRIVGGTTMLQADGQGGKALGGVSKTGVEARAFSDIAVLFRTGRQAEALEECFLKEGIPYRVVGRGSFMEDEAVREALSFFSCVVNPGDDFHLLISLGAGFFGLGKEGVAAVREAARQMACPVWRAIVEMTEGRRKSGSAVLKKLLAFKKALETYRSLMEFQPPERLLARWIEETNLQGSEAMNRLLGIASRFNDLPTFLSRVFVAQEADHERMGNNVTSPEAVTLMTLHAAKGLEFPVVFIAGVEEGLIPLQDNETFPYAEDRVAEERRLFYVGMTRARDELILVSARNRRQFGKKQSTRPSPFLLDIPAGCLEKKSWPDQAKRKKGDGDEQYKQLSLF